MKGYYGKRLWNTARIMWLVLTVIAVVALVFTTLNREKIGVVPMIMSTIVSWAFFTLFVAADDDHWVEIVFTDKKLEINQKNSRYEIPWLDIREIHAKFNQDLEPFAHDADVFQIFVYGVPGTPIASFDTRALSLNDEMKVSDTLMEYTTANKIPVIC